MEERRGDIERKVKAEKKWDKYRKRFRNPLVLDRL